MHNFSSPRRSKFPVSSVGWSSFETRVWPLCHSPCLLAWQINASFAFSPQPSPHWISGQSCSCPQAVGWASCCREQFPGSLPWSPATKGLPLWFVWLFGDCQPSVPRRNSGCLKPSSQIQPRVLREISGGYACQINQKSQLFSVPTVALLVTSSCFTPEQNGSS